MKNKKYTFTDGCIAGSLEVNEENFNDMSPVEKVEAMKSLVEFVFSQKDDEERQYLIDDMLTLLFPMISESEKEFNYADDESEMHYSNIMVFKRVISGKKVVMIEVCSEPILIVDGWSWKSLSEDKQKDILLQVISLSGENSYMNNCFIDILKLYGKCEFLYHCDCCGDSVHEYTLSIES